jgi:hypothetical protein
MLPTDVPEYRVHTQPSRVEHWRHLVEIVTLVTAAVWAFYVFVYQERIKPASELPSLQVSASVAHEPLHGGKELVTINVTLNDTGSNDVSMASLLVNAHGVLYKGSASEAQEIRPANGITIVSHTLRGSDPELLYSHFSLWEPLGATRRTLRLPKGEQLSFAEPFVIERGRYDTLRVTYAYCYQRYDDETVSVYKPKRTPDGAFEIRDVVAANATHAGLRCGGTNSYAGEYAL